MQSLENTRGDEDIPMGDGGRESSWKEKKGKPEGETRGPIRLSNLTKAKCVCSDQNTSRRDTKDGFITSLYSRFILK